ncbi:excinuclease ABC subunit UvrC [Wenzhouxiangella sp. XN79A]|uniref:excinuclease ABC subunit UvrC n=1 Tax=Wenzhouxiangella sp. XN79A TaxID=2724193 RepID=UPI00144A7C0A|nr:excinuclease ABC subunit UvrC [Wenzhouxiangella sp. XN79A]NKI35478.1 excinuclease ABC subunit UvrC [Wenzhouxiangella sp. XN79A]
MSGSKTEFDGRAFARNLAQAPGVYLMRDEQGRPLYVGKARNLRKRVSSYFDRRDKGPRIGLMVSKIRAIEVSITRTEAEALLLENEWIKALRPRYNINLRDDKSYPWIRLTTQQEFPRIGFYRGGRSRPGEYFGPYSSAGAVREALNQVYRLFGVRQCRDSVFKNRTRPCLQYQIKRCTAPCVGLISERDYAADVDAARAFLKGENETVVEHLGERMQTASKALDFEAAAQLRDRIQAIRKIQSSQFVTDGAEELDVIALAAEGGTVAVQVVEFRAGRNVGGRSFFPTNVEADAHEPDIMAAFLGQYYAERLPPAEILVSVRPADDELLTEALKSRRQRPLKIASRVRGDRRQWIQMAESNARDALRRRLSERDQVGRELAALAELLKLDAPPARIECFDISHISGTETVASCVVHTDRGMQKKFYRTFNIEGITPGDDYAAMEQALRRRYRRVLEEDPAQLPDLVLIDGGRGQSDRARAVLAELGLDALPVVGIAKGPARRAGHETWVMAGREAVPGPNHPASLLAQRIRDEAHRFAVRGHRKRRQKRATASPLEAVPGVGPKRRQQLLNHFGGLKGVRAAGVEELMRVDGINAQLAEAIYRQLRD